jgi:mannose-6-phosphate isomerase-like protein (cupin superfamily)
MKPKPALHDIIRRSETYRCTDGTPQVDGLPTDLIRQGDAPYLERHFLIGGKGSSSARYHHILTSDPQHLHDHPWDFISVIISGSYIETTEDNEVEYGPGSVLVRRAEQLHRLTLTNGPVWTFVTTSAPRRTWGFAADDGWMPWWQYQDTDQSAKRTNG